MAVSKSVKAQAKSKIKAKAKSTTRTRVKAKRTPGRPTQEDIADIEEKLLAVALQEFQVHGYGAASMTRIVTTAGMSKTTLYSRYPSKEHLFRAILKKQIQRYSPWASLDVDSAAPNLERGLKNYANRTLELSLKNDEVAVNHLIYTEINRFPELGEAAAERTAMGIERVAEFIRKCSQAENMPCKDPQGIAEVFIHMLRGWYINVMLSNREVTEKQRKQWVNRAVKSLMLAREDW
ncbi:MAG: TetR/AcrR family transcriptional regulator [Pseudomonadales bacterium]|nr:TetR/AcrR family transcriptional regulator [Pseudomonadales bacterium]